MRLSVLIVALLAIQACSSLPERRVFTFDPEAAVIAQVDETVKAQVARCSHAHTLTSARCDLMMWSNDEDRAFRINSSYVDASNAATIAAAGYIGSTVVLNSDGLSDTETRDILEATLGVALINLGKQFYNPATVREPHLRASRAYRCLANVTSQVIAREADLADANRQLGLLLPQLANLEDALADGRGDADAQIVATGDAAVATAKQARESLRQQNRAYNDFPDTLTIASQTIYDAMIDQLKTQEIALAALVDAIRLVEQQSAAFMNRPAPPAVPGEEGLEQSNETAIVNLTRDVSRRTAELQSITPNIAAVAGHAKQCPSVIATGAAPAPPGDVGDNGGGDASTVEETRDENENEDEVDAGGVAN